MITIRYMPPIRSITMDTISMSLKGVIHVKSIIARWIFRECTEHCVCGAVSSLSRSIDTIALHKAGHEQGHKIVECKALVCEYSTHRMFLSIFLRS